MAEASTQLTVDQLTPGELEGLQAVGRIKDGRIVPEEPAGATQVVTGPLPADQIPPMPAGVAERIKAAKELQSSFIVTDGEGKVAKASNDGGALAQKKEAETNPDWPGKVAEPVIEFQDKMNFLAAMLGAGRFTKDYPLFGGAVKVRFQTLSDKENDACAIQAYLDDKIEGTLATNLKEAGAVRLQRYQNYQFTASLAALQPAGATPPRLFSPFSAKELKEAHVTPIRSAHQEQQAEFPSPFLNALRNAHHRFVRLVVTMQEAADKPDFWRAASDA